MSPMSDKDDKAGDEPAAERATTEDATFDTVDSEDGVDAAAGDDTGARPRARKWPGGTASVAWLSLFLALIGVAGVGYVLLDDSSEDRVLDDARTAVDNLRDDIAEANDGIEALGDEVAGLRSTAGTARDDRSALQTELDRLEREIEERGDLVESLPPRMRSLEETVAGLQGVSIEARNTYLVAEAEYYMQIANAQLQLAGNPHLASLALGQADDRLLQLADPALTSVRRALSNEIAALDAMEKPDLAGATLTLGSLSRVVDTLPLRTVDGTGGADDSLANDTDGSGISRAWNSVRDAFSGLVKVTPPADERAPLLMPEAEPLIRSNVSLMLQAARLALLRGEQAIFEQSLDDADAWLSSYFDADSTQVESARETIAEIRSDYATTTPPDISESLRLLRQYKALAEPSR